MTVFAIITGVALIVIGGAWWWLAGVSAERPASLLVIVGMGFCILAIWPPSAFWIGFGGMGLVTLGAIMALTRPRGGER